MPPENNNTNLTPEQIEELVAQRDQLTADLDHERNARHEEARRADGLSVQVTSDRARLIAGQVANAETQEARAKQAIDGIGAEMSGYRQQLSALQADGKFDEAAEVQEKMADAAARRNQAQQAQTYWAQQREVAKAQPVDPIDEFFRQNPNYNEAEQAWIRRNPRYATDMNFRNRVNQAHLELQKGGKADGSTQYFEALGQAGYMQAPPRQAPARQQQQQNGGDGGSAGADGGDADGSPYSEAAGEEPEVPQQQQQRQPAARAAAPSRRAPAQQTRQGSSRRLSTDEAEAALAMSEYFPEDVQNGGEAAIFAYYADIKDNSPMAKRLRENWRGGA